jgi:hypothetical protein
MRRRASLAMLMGLVAIIAVGLAAMKVATDGASRLVFGSGLLSLLVGTLGALVRRRGRAAWVGFALFGWAYALVLLVPPLRNSIAAELPGEGPLEEVVDLIQPPLALPAEPAFYMPSDAIVRKGEDGRYHYTAPGGQNVLLAPQETKQWDAYLGRMDAFMARRESAHQARRIGLAFLGLAFAVLGAATGQVLEDRNPVAVASPTLETPAPPG